MSAPAPPPIASRENPRFRALLALATHGRARREAGVALIDGVHLCEAWWRAGRTLRRIVVTPQALADAEVAALFQRLPRRLRDEALCLSEARFRELGELGHGVGLLAEIDLPRASLPAAVDADALYLDRVQDPGNAGTLLRTAAAAGVGRVFAAPGTAQLWSPKVLRAAMGAHLALELHEGIDWDVLAPRLRIGVRAAVLEGAASLWAADLRSPALWAFGHEGQGLDDRVLADDRVQRLCIPMAAGVESLNVAAAAAVALFEQRRQRGAG